MARFNLPLDSQYACLATPRVANARRVRKSAAFIGANDDMSFMSARRAALLKIATIALMLTATAALAFRLAH
jgi:hypothetical protein